MLFVPVALPVAGGFGLPGALGKMPRRPCDPTTCVGASSFCVKDDCWASWPVLDMLGRPLMAPVTPPGGIGRMVGRPTEDVVAGMDVAVEEGYIMEDDMP